MKRYQYFVLMVAHPSMGIYEKSDLQKLLDQGWHPVRETPMGGVPMRGDNRSDGITFVFASLILLEKDVSDKS